MCALLGVDDTSRLKIVGVYDGSLASVDPSKKIVGSSNGTVSIIAFID